MTIRGNRVVITGGSIAGCAAAIALQRAGCEVQIYERSSRELRDRGSGIAIPGALRDELIGADYLPQTYPNCAFAQRRWVLADGSADGRTLWMQPSPVTTNNWGMLWRALRERVSDAVYREGVEFRDFRQEGGVVHVELSDGTKVEADLLIGADGYRSRVRSELHPGSHQDYAGYILWRGNYPETRIGDNAVIRAADEQQAWHTVAFPGGHCIIYMIPDWDSRPGEDRRRLNWAIYTPTPAGLDVREPHAIPPGAVQADWYAELERVLDEHFPPDYAALIRASPLPEVSIQPVYDEHVDSYADGRVALIGDAGSITRPHTGSGATKALQDARALERLTGEHDNWDDILRVYDEERASAGAAIMEMGRRIGRAQVEHTPDWAAMKPADFEDWTRAMLAGEKLYIYGNEPADAH